MTAAALRIRIVAAIAGISYCELTAEYIVEVEVISTRRSCKLRKAFVAFRAPLQDSLLQVLVLPRRAGRGISQRRNTSNDGQLEPQGAGVMRVPLAPWKVGRHYSNARCSAV